MVYHIIILNWNQDKTKLEMRHSKDCKCNYSIKEIDIIESNFLPGTIVANLNE